MYCMYAHIYACFESVVFQGGGHVRARTVSFKFGAGWSWRMCIVSHWRSTGFTFGRSEFVSGWQRSNMFVSLLPSPLMN